MVRVGSDDLVESTGRGGGCFAMIGSLGRGWAPSGGFSGDRITPHYKPYKRPFGRGTTLLGY